jgi:hypothetical protein
MPFVSDALREVDVSLDACVVHQDVERAEVGDDVLDQLSPVALAGDVARSDVKTRVHPLSFEELGLVATADDDLAACVEEGFRHREADAGRAARDEHGVPREVHARPALVDAAAGYPTDCAKRTCWSERSLSFFASPCLSQLWNHAASPCEAANRYTLPAMRPVSTK